MSLAKQTSLLLLAFSTTWVFHFETAVAAGSSSDKSEQTESKQKKATRLTADLNHMRIQIQENAASLKLKVNEFRKALAQDPKSPKVKVLRVDLAKDSNSLLGTIAGAIELLNKVEPRPADFEVRRQQLENVFHGVVDYKAKVVIPLTTQEPQASKSEAFDANDPHSKEWNEFKAVVRSWKTAIEKDPMGKNVEKLRGMVAQHGASLVGQIARDMDQLIRTTPRAAKFDSQWSVLESKLAEIAQYQAKFVLPFVVVRDPSRPAGPGNIGLGEFETRYAATEGQIRLERPTNMRYRLSELARKGGEGALSFSSQYVTYAVASSIITISMLGTSSGYGENPIAFQDLKKSLADKSAMLTLGIFSATQHPISKLLQGVGSGLVPESLIPSIGMAAGFMASTVFSEMYADQDLHKCITSRFAAARGVGSVDDASCDKSFDTWAVHNKVIQYAPTMTSLLATAFLTSKVRAAMGGGVDVTKVILKGVRIFPRASRAMQAFALAGAGGFTPLGIAVGVGDFVLFLAIDKVVSPIIDTQWKFWQLGTFNVKTWLDKHGLHREFLFPVDLTRAPIQNALDVEATDLQSAHEYIVKMLKQMQQSNWQMPTSADTCTAGKLIVAATPSVTGLIGQKFDQLAQVIGPGPEADAPKDQSWFSALQDGAVRVVREIGALSASTVAAPLKVPDRLRQYSASLINHKTQDELSCEVLHRPTDLIGRYSDMNYQWRKFLNKDFEDAFYKWMELIGQFSEQYQAANKIMQYFASSKFNEVHHAAKRPNLSDKAITKVLMGSVEDAGKGIDALNGTATMKEAPAAPSMIAGIETPTMAEYIVSALACGPSPNQANRWSGKLMEKVEQNWNKIFGGPKYILTPYGSSLSFVPPNMTDEADVCSRTVTWNTAQAAAARGLVSGSSHAFYDDWSASNKTYSSLADYVYDHLRPETWNSNIRTTGFPMWWEKEIKPRVKPVWDDYQSRYTDLVSRKFLPVVNRREFSRGCSMSGRVSPLAAAAFDAQGFSNQSTRWVWFSKSATASSGQDVFCPDSPMSFRLSKGLLQSMEVEMRVYVRSLYAIYMSSTPIQSRLASGREFVRRANLLYAELGSKTTTQVRQKRVFAAFAKLTELFAGHDDLLASRQSNEAAAILIGDPLLVNNSTKEQAAHVPHTYKAEMYASIWEKAKMVVDEFQAHVDYVEAFDFEGANSRAGVKRDYKKPSLGPLTGS